MTIEELRNKLNHIIERGYGDVSVIGIKHDLGCFDDNTPDYEWEYLEDVKIVDRDGHGGAGLNLIMEE